jgi:hypothetical protein
LTIKCLDLMRSAVQRFGRHFAVGRLQDLLLLPTAYCALQTSVVSCISFTTYPYSIVKETL